MAHLTPEEFEAAFDSLFRESAFRLESLDNYAVGPENEPFRRFLAGQPQEPDWHKPWQDFVRRSLDEGKTMARVHVVTEPLSDYLRFEVTCGYPLSVDAGEDVRIIRRPVRSPVALPGHDFWMFNDSDVVVMDYDENGHFHGGETVSDIGEIAFYRRIRDVTMQHSIPLDDYLASLNLKEIA